MVTLVCQQNSARTRVKHRDTGTFYRGYPGIVVLSGNRYDLCIMDDAQQWANRLGMARVNPFFPAKLVVPGEHSAMLDGRRASFACSTIETPDVLAEDSKNWQWSADLAHHVVITPHTVHVRSGRDPSFRPFQRESVESRLEDFLTFLDSSRRSALSDVVSFLVEEFRAIWATSNLGDGASALVPFLLALCAVETDDPGILGDPVWCRDTAVDIGIDDPSLARGAT
jgi:hypothetical protein